MVETSLTFLHFSIFYLFSTFLHNSRRIKVESDRGIESVSFESSNSGEANNAKNPLTMHRASAKKKKKNRRKCFFLLGRRFIFELGLLSVESVPNKRKAKHSTNHSSTYECMGIPVGTCIMGLLLK